MRRSPRTALLALALAVLALAAAGCGGSEVAAHEVPGPPPALTVPTDGELSSGAADPDADADPDATAEPDAGTTEPDAGVVPEDSSGGAVAPETEEAPAVPEETAAPEETPPPAGSAPEQFESFCEQNAGAC